MKSILKKLIRFFRPVYWPLVKAYYFTFKPETEGTRIILTHKNEILFVKNSYGLKCNFPGGGLGKNESPEEGVKREVKEELGINVGNIKFLGTIVPPIEYEYRKNTISVFTAELPDKNIKINSLEIAEIKWCPVENPPSMGHVATLIFELYKKSK